MMAMKMEKMRLRASVRLEDGWRKAMPLVRPILRSSYSWPST